MRSYTKYVLAVVGCAILAFALMAAPHPAQAPGHGQLISNNALLAGLAPGAVFPFIDTTPNSILRAHIAVTDATSNCAAGAAAPASVQVLVGQAGVALVSVMSTATNTGISTTPGQCVFHVTVSPGQGGVPAAVTDIVVHNAGAGALTGVHTVTATAEVALEAGHGEQGDDTTGERR